MICRPTSFDICCIMGLSGSNMIKYIYLPVWLWPIIIWVAVFFPSLVVSSCLVLVMTALFGSFTCSITSQSPLTRVHAIASIWLLFSLFCLCCAPLCRAVLCTTMSRCVVDHYVALCCGPLCRAVLSLVCWQ